MDLIPLEERGREEWTQSKTAHQTGSNDSRFAAKLVGPTYPRMESVGLKVTP